MSRKVLISDEARDDIEAGKDFYAACEFDAGDYFASSILNDISALQIYLGLHAKHYGFHRLLSKRFPYSIYYYVVEEVVMIVAVLDMRMKPTSLRDIMTKRKKSC